MDEIIDREVVCDPSMVKAQVDMIIEEVKVLEQKHGEALKLIKTMADYLEYLSNWNKPPAAAAPELVSMARKLLLNT